jgi:hypothetical protein
VSSETLRGADPVEAGVVLYPQFERTALDYFRRHHIRWWGDGNGPTGSPISSQVACVNHLEPARLDPAIALALTEAVLPTAERVLAVEDGGCVAYEWIGERNYLGERGQTRGAVRTSLDALMVAEAEDQRVLLLIEWKYTESYRPGKSRARSERGTDRIAIYRPFLERPDCPIRVADDRFHVLCYDPLEQLMRQTLLGWQMVEAGELGADDWRHVWIVPDGNAELQAANPSPDLPGDSLGDAWSGVLREPAWFSILSPSELLAGVDPPEHWREWREWLRTRYGT